MPKYNIFEQFIDDDIKNQHNISMAQTKALHDASNLVCNAMDSSLMSQKELSKYLGISEGYVSRILSGTENLSIKNLSKILYMLGYELNLSANERGVCSDENDNIIWIDFSNNDSQVQVTCSISESNSSSPWLDIHTPEAI
jgi:transcriptional regulator with XRE-family HTH domain